MPTYVHVIPEVIHAASGGWRRAWPEVLACVDAARHDADSRHVLVVIGGSDAGRDAVSLGAEDVVRVCPPTGKPERASRGIERAIDAADADVVVAWDREMAGWMGSLRGVPDRLARVDLDTGQVECRGVDPESGEVMRHWTTLHAAELVPPEAGTRDSLRAQLGIEPTAAVVGVLGDWPEKSNATGYALGMLGVSGLACMGLADRGEPWRGPLQRHIREARHARGLVFSTQPSVCLWPAIDLWLLARPVGGETALAWLSMARGLLSRGAAVAHAGEQGLAEFAGSVKARSAQPMDLARAARRCLEDRGWLTGPGRGFDAAAPSENTAMGAQIVASLRDLEVLA